MPLRDGACLCVSERHSTSPYPNHLQVSGKIIEEDGQEQAVQEIYGEWYALTDDELRRVVADGRIVLDANVLLDLYRHGEHTREDLLQALEHELVRPRLFLPYQAGLEYHSRRLQVATEHYGHYEKIDTALKAAEEWRSSLRTLSQALGELRDPEVKKRLEAVAEKSVKKAARKIRKALRAERELNVYSPERLRDDDPLRDRIENLFADEGQLAERPTSEQRKLDEDDARKRLKEGRRPGNEDKDKSDGGIGDPLIWMEMKQLAEDSHLPVLFVSNDVKSDWDLEIGHRKIGPQPDLRREFQADTGQGFHKTRWHSFLVYIDKYLNVEVDKDTLAKVETRRSSPTHPTQPLTGSAGFRTAHQALTNAQIRDILRPGGSVYEDFLSTPDLAESIKRAGTGLNSEILREALRAAAGAPIVWRMTDIMNHEQDVPDDDEEEDDDGHLA